MEFREVFKEQLKNELLNGVDSFCEFWKNLKLFSGHSMEEYRSKYSLSNPDWTAGEVERYLDCFFTTSQIRPTFDPNVFYFYGFRDQKYSAEAQKLRAYFNIEEFDCAGHRAIFEDVDEFKIRLKRICDASLL